MYNFTIDPKHCVSFKLKNYNTGRFNIYKSEISSGQICLIYEWGFNLIALLV